MKFFLVLVVLVGAAVGSPASKYFNRLIFYPSSITPFLQSVGRVSNGLNAAPGQAPYTCSLRWGIANQAHACGATLLTNQFLLTAAHCLSGLSTGQFDIQCGVTNRITDVATQQVRAITNLNTDVFYPPGWTGSIYSDDIAVIRVATPFVLNDLVRPIPLRAAGFNDNGNVASIFGWGSRNGTTSSPMEGLQTAEMDVSDGATCRIVMGNINAALANFVTDNCLCASRGTYSVCGGDSGSPLVVTENGEDILVGLAAWGLSPCGSIAGAPSIFSRISAFNDWIEGVVGQPLVV